MFIQEFIVIEILFNCLTKLLNYQILKNANFKITFHLSILLCL